MNNEESFEQESSEHEHEHEQEESESLLYKSMLNTTLGLEKSSQFEYLFVNDDGNDDDEEEEKKKKKKATNVDSSSSSLSLPSAAAAASEFRRNSELQLEWEVQQKQSNEWVTATRLNMARRRNHTAAFLGQMIS